MVAGERRRLLAEHLEAARRRGMLGPGPVDAHVQHAAAMADAIDPAFGGRFLDLGSGAGVPGLMLLDGWPAASGVLLDARRRSCRLLADALRKLELADRGSVACGRAEALARDDRLRGAFDLVVARGFGSPATTAECAVGFLGPGGRLAVSEPPGVPRPDRWPVEGLGELGMGRAELRRGAGAGIAVIKATGALSERWPRGPGVPGRRPLW